MSGRIDEAVGVIDGSNLDFSTPDPYVAGTLVVFLNGRQLTAARDNGWVEVDPDAGTFRMKIPPKAALPGVVEDGGDTLFAYYRTEESVGGADGGVPLMTGAELVRPIAAGAVELRPEMISAEEE